MKSECQPPYLDVGLTQVKVTHVGRFVPFSNSVCTAAGQVMVQYLEVVERSEHMDDLYVTLPMSKWEMFRFVRLLQR